ncbi:MAG: hypothetical protein R3C97_04215 [Geminicoccaceae bacterium]
MYLYILTLFVSAIAVFLVQPMFSRMILPLYGGSPSVWTTAMLFFQTALLAGYFYAHLLAARLSLKVQLGLHGLILALGALLLPVIPRPEINPFAGADFVPAELLGLMLVSVGLPFVIVSATAPCLQRWFSHTDHPQAADPYFLYAASNVGSILALLGYPFLVEPLVGLGRQAALWSGVYALLFALVLASGFWALRHQRAGDPQGGGEEADVLRGAARRPILFWLVLSAIPSALLHATTLHITTDIATAPLLWVVPLTLYLLTFVLAFARRQILPADIVLRYLVPIPVLLAILTISLPLVWLFGLVVALALLFILTLACHQRLASLRPDASGLTLFYLVMATGGVVGGVFATLLAPVLFTRQYEFPLLIAASLVVLPAAAPSIDRRWWLWLPLALLVAAAGLALHWFELGRIAIILFLLLVLVGGTAFKNAPRGLAAIFAGAVIGLWAVKDNHVLERERSFFGIYTVASDEDEATGPASGSATARPCMACSRSIPTCATRRFPITIPTGRSVRSCRK